ncbi:DUF4974 domain-containing protein [Bacteroides thetaiotaomicron]|jgi:transmembrane sensor|uniref:FecR family protein n=1 Tax=Bacteroides TaxID=816 RepID=UPI000ED3A5D3|nr:FecR domain-containing protein [Bacteroides thetaiotaomicron]RGP00687.1 DUF4974 domain-containing protein [Bacteroides thetaiotaomicron]
MKRKQRKNINEIANRLISYYKFRDHAKRDDEAEIWQRIIGEISKEERKLYIRRRVRWVSITISAVAACILCLLYIGESDFANEVHGLEDYVGRLSDVVGSEGKVQLLLSNERTVDFDKDSVGIAYTSKGDIQINKEVASDVNVQKVHMEKEEFNQIIVPNGKYTQLTLADGTRMHINSGSRVVYPRVFTGDLREIYVEGEVFLDVTPDKRKPFRVKTSQFEVEVLGTSFNVNAYKQRNQGEVVLVEGSVELYDKHDNRILLKPDNLVTVHNGQAGDIKHVNAKDYTAWIDGLLILHTEPLKDVFEKLNRYYNVPIVVDSAIQTEIADGKLDLRIPLPELIRMISVVLPIDYKLNDGTYYITSKEK